MAYDKQTWENYPSLATPISAERLGHMEDGIFAVASEADTLAGEIAAVYGSQIIIGHGVPSDATGNHTDIYIDQDSYALYKKGVSVWGAPYGNIKGPANVMSIGTVTTGAAGSSATAGITGTTPAQVLNLTIPRGDTGATGPANTLAVGTVTTGAAGSSVAVTITGSAPSQTLNLTIPRGDTGATGPANTLAIGTVTTGAAGSAATAGITGSAPSQTLNLTIPRGDTGATGPANTLAIGTVTTGAAGSAASATITGSAPSQTLNLTIPRGDTGAGGSPGTPGTNGTNGSNVLLTVGVPGSGVGSNGDYAINTSTGDTYGPKAAGAWGAITGNVIPTIINANAQAASYMLVLSDAGKLIESTGSSAFTLTVPNSSSVAFATGTVIQVLQYGTGQVTLAPAAGVTLRFASSLTSRAQYSALVIRNRGSNEWIVSGDAT